MFPSHLFDDVLLFKLDVKVLQFRYGDELLKINKMFPEIVSCNYHLERACGNEAILTKF